MGYCLNGITKRRAKTPKCMVFPSMRLYTALRDPLSRTINDPLHSKGEERLVLIGESQRGRLLVVVHTERDDRIRIISARLATNKERLRY